MSRLRRISLREVLIGLLAFLILAALFGGDRETITADEHPRTIFIPDQDQQREMLEDMALHD